MALRAAVAVLIAHLGLEEMAEVGRRAQHPVGAGAHAELAGGAVVVERLHAPGARRDQARAALGGFLGKHLREAALRMLGLRGQRGADQRRGGEEGAAAAVGLVFASGLAGLLPESGEAVFQGALLAVVDAVETHHAARIVDAVVLDVDARGLAVLLAELAVLAAKAAEVCPAVCEGAHGNVLHDVFLADSFSLHDCPLGTLALEASGYELDLVLSVDFGEANNLGECVIDEHRLAGCEFMIFDSLEKCLYVVAVLEHNLFLLDS